MPPFEGFTLDKETVMITADKEKEKPKRVIFDVHGYPHAVDEYMDANDLTYEERAKLEGQPFDM